MKSQSAKRQELGWALLVLIANFVLFASHAWALGSGLPEAGPAQEVVRCAFYDAKDADPTAFATESACHAAHEQCMRGCSVSSYSCIAQGAHGDGKHCREVGFSEISEADARSRALMSCIASGGEDCQILKCTESQRDVTPPT